MSSCANSLYKNLLHKGVVALILAGVFLSCKDRQLPTSDLTCANLYHWDCMNDGVNAGVFCILGCKDPDGKEYLYAGGNFTSAAGIKALYIAKWDGCCQWSQVDSGMNEYVNALCVYKNELYAGGKFTSAGGVTVNHIAKLTNGHWSPLGQGVSIGVGDEVRALFVYNGMLYVGGTFSSAGGQATTCLAAWDGTQWHLFPNMLHLAQVGDGRGFVNALTEYNNKLIIGGDFGLYAPAGNPVGHIVQWDGIAFSQLVDGLSTSVKCATVYKGALFVGGLFINPALHLAKWDGSRWSPVGSGFNDWVWTLCSDENNLYAGGRFLSTGNVNVNNLARWNGSNWCPITGGIYYFPYPSGGQLPTAIEGVRTIGFYHNAIVVGGDFTRVIDPPPHSNTSVMNPPLSFNHIAQIHPDF